MGGLDYTNQTPATDGAAASQDTAYTQVNTPKSKYLPTGISAGALSPQQTNELLANMQRMIEQRTGAWNTMMGGIQDALAFTAPVANGQQAVALQYRNEQKRKEAEELMGMQTAMASVAGQQQLAQANAMRARNLINGGGGEGGGAGTADVVGGGQPKPGTFASLPAEDQQRIMNAPEYLQFDMIQDALKQAGRKRLDLVNSPAYFEQKKYQIPGYGEEMLNVPEYEKWRSTGYLPDGTYAPPPGLPKQPASKSPGLRSAAEGAPQMQSDFAKFVEKVEGSPEGSVSPKGATTTMQVMPKTAMKPGYGVRPAADNSPEEIKRVGWDYADAMKKRYAGDEEAALIAYNAGPVVADKFLKAGRDPAVLPKETINYLARATELRNQKPTQEASAGAPVSDAVSPPKRQQGEPLNVYQSRLQQWEKNQEPMRAAREKQMTKESEEEGEKRAGYAGSVGLAGDSYSKLSDLLNVSKGQKTIFNLKGQGILNPALNVLIKEPPHTNAEGKVYDPNAKLADWTLNQAEQTAYGQVAKGSAEAQAAWAKNLVQGAGSRLTNVDLGLGKIAKGVGTDVTYDAHMFNLAKNMEAAKTVYYRGLAYQDWAKKHPNAPISEFENTDEYKIDAKVKAAKDVAKEFQDVPEVISKGGKSGNAFIQMDKNGKQYIVVNGKGYYL